MAIKSFINTLKKLQNQLKNKKIKLKSEEQESKEIEAEKEKEQEEMGREKDFNKMVSNVSSTGNVKNNVA